MIQLNWFAVQLPADHATLPAARFASTIAVKDYLASNDGLRERSYRARSDDGTPLLVVLTGALPGGTAWQDHTFPLAENWGLFSRAVENSLAAHFLSAGAEVGQSRWETQATRRVRERVPTGLRLSTGVAAKPYHVQPEAQLGVVLSWKVVAAFSVGLEDPTMRTIAIGKPALAVRMGGGIQHRGFLGIVTGFTAEGQVEVEGRDGKATAYAPNTVSLEATAETLRAYEAAATSNASVRSAWRRIQELSFSLSPNGRRNNAVLRDRMRAARDFVFGEHDSIALHLPGQFGGSASLTSQPFQAPLNQIAT